MSLALTSLRVVLDFQNRDVVIELVNVTTGCIGNDIRLDDISFREIINFCDCDGDGIANIYDLDSDNDGISDLHEAGHNAADANNDGIIDGSNSDFGANGLFNNIETFADSDIINYSIKNSESSPDGIIDACEIDADGDGCFDTREAIVSDIDNDGVAGTGTPTITSLGLVSGLNYAYPTNNSWQNHLDKSNCTEICNNGIDDDVDGLIDCADSDCIPLISNVNLTQPTCTNKTGGLITISATGSGTLSYSINNEPNWQASNTFTGLGIGQYTIRVRNDSGCETEYASNPIILDFESCIEICNDGIDNDGDGLVDCDDSDCGVDNAQDMINNK